LSDTVGITQVTQLWDNEFNAHYHMLLVLHLAD
jgi:hypothetical protein